MRIITITSYYNDLNVGKRTYTSMYLSSTFIQSLFSVMLHTFPWTTSDPTFERYYEQLKSSVKVKIS